VSTAAFRLPVRRRVLAPGARVAVTGAGGYSGRVLTRALLESGVRVTNLTGHPERGTPFGERVQSARLDFARPLELEESLQGCDVLFNTYWVRFALAGKDHDVAVRNSATLFEVARRAGVRRIVHTSVANPSEDSSLTYYRGKARVERALRESGLAYAILRPTVFFGEGDVLMTNLAWCARHSPVFLVPGDGRYRVQPVHVADFATAMARAAEAEENFVADAAGPEVYTFDELVLRVGRAMGKRPRIVHAPAGIVRAATAVLGALHGDVLLTRAEIDALEDDLLASRGAPTGSTSLGAWFDENSANLGRSWANEIGLHYR
jgi:NADH dehydrogenase